MDSRNDLLQGAFFTPPPGEQQRRYVDQWEEEGHDGAVIDVPTPLDPDRMKPLSDRAREGRANSKGIPVIYLATELETAVAEIRPWVGAYVSVGTFRITRPLRIVNLDAGDASGKKFYREEPDAPERAVWADLDRAFSTPVNPSDDLADYAPTQIVAELISPHSPFRCRSYSASQVPRSRWFRGWANTVVVSV